MFCIYRIGGMKRKLMECSLLNFPFSKILVVPLFYSQKGIILLFQPKNFCYKLTATSLQRLLFFAGSPLVSVPNCVPFFHPQRDQVEKYFLYSYGFVPIQAPEAGD